MVIYLIPNDFPHLLTKEQAAKFLGVDTKSFDKYIRPNTELKRVNLGKRERYTLSDLIKYIETQKQ
ncbi:helix-turn-helix domain-containing protein [Mammaliicoccus vitulinus]|uniref:helix-turn-helix domain-containing protein n=1 Tax=Mammaliicoccus vitulinus TaxID=71237 RepID=UPI00248BE07D|nr:helix-turn-helix domain-containing protein [Mammaliicoccus vitulinus]